MGSDVSSLPPVNEVSDEELLNQPDNPQAELAEAIEDTEQDVINIVRQIDFQERPTREILIKIWKYLDLLWTGVANFYWNSTSNQWQPITYDDIRHLSESADVDPTLMNKTINMLRPYGESIIGALTTAMPSNKYFPADAESIDDINTSRAYTSIEKKICQDNKMKIKIVQMIMNLLTGGFFAAYNYSHESESYGTITQPTYDTKKFRITTSECPVCGFEFSVDQTPELDTNDSAKNVESGMEETVNEGIEKDESQPNISGLLSEDASENGTPENVNPPAPETQCPNCGGMVSPTTNQDIQEQRVQTGNVIIPKCRQLIEVYGPLNVKIPTHASTKDDILWCILEDEIHESKARYLYPKYYDKILPGPKDDLAYDRWARSQYENMGELNQYYVTRRRVWIRPSGYHILGNKETPERLNNLFPKGLMAVFMNQTLLYIEESEMDDHWTFSFNPIYRRYYGDPLLKAGIPLQETANDMFQLEIETIKYSIPQTFADPEYFDFNAYAKSKNQPGLVYPMKMPPGGQLQNALAETRTATLPKEVEALDEKLERLFQFVLGVFPSVFGGEASGSKTLGEYEQSRGQALQRLSINPQEVVHTAYAELMGKAIRGYIDDLVEDEVYVQSKGTSFINTWIRKADLQGRIGEVVPEQSEQFPISWGQKVAKWMELIGLNNQFITAILFNPNNVEYLKEILSMEELYIPGDDQRNKQLEEIRTLISIQPQVDPVSGEPIQVPLLASTVQIEPIDDNAIHHEVISAFICSQMGQALKDANPLAYQNLILHDMEHQQALQAQMQAQMAQQAQMNPQNDPNQVGDANA